MLVNILGKRDSSALYQQLRQRLIGGASEEPGTRRDALRL